jgi:membrane-associated phospholipid phosphatase
MSTFAFWVAHTRTSERIVVLFFVYTAALSVVYRLPLPQILMCVATPLTLFALACAETSVGTRGTRIARDWMVPAAILGAYWQMGLFARSHDAAWQQLFLSWDRLILDEWRLRNLLEIEWLPIVSLVELSYLLLYAIPPACIAVLYKEGARIQIDRFLTTFALGALTAYALLPLCAVQSPRIAFPGQDLPAVASMWRGINTWILDHLDISTSVFPSGHVAVAFSCAFGLRRALPAGKQYFRFFLLLACLVLTATIYGRYHYAADGFASLIICVATCRICEAYEQRH